MKQIIVASAFIHKDGKVLIAKRAESKEFLPGIFELPGGKVDFGESPQEAVAREVKEEVGLDIEVGEPFYVFSYMIGEDRQGIEIEFFASLKDPHQQITENPEDHSEYRWIGPDEVDDHFDHQKAVADVFRIRPSHPAINDDGPVTNVMHRGFELLAKGAV